MTTIYANRCDSQCQYDRAIKARLEAQMLEKQVYIDKIESDVQMLIDKGFVNLSEEETARLDDLQSKLQESIEQMHYYEDELNQFNGTADVSEGGGGRVPVTALHFWTCLDTEKCYVVRDSHQHESDDGYIAVDIGTDLKPIDIYAPAYQDTAQEYEVELIDDDSTKYTTGRTIKLTFKDSPNMYWLIGHVAEYRSILRNGKEVATGDRLGTVGGCGIGGTNQENRDASIERGEGVSTGCHVHLELWIDGSPVHFDSDEEPAVAENATRAKFALVQNGRFADLKQFLRDKGSPFSEVDFDATFSVLTYEEAKLLIAITGKESKYGTVYKSTTHGIDYERGVKYHNPAGVKQCVAKHQTEAYTCPDKTPIPDSEGFWLQKYDNFDQFFGTYAYQMKGGYFDKDCTTASCISKYYVGTKTTYPKQGWVDDVMHFYNELP